MATEEHTRLDEHAQRTAHWRRWGPYLADRQWGTVREDYSADGNAWAYLTHDMARSFAYRWGEDGLAGISDNHQRLCFALALWNGQDPCLKERLFGLSNDDGNLGEDVKECYWHIDNTPTHAYMRMQYRYPQAAFPYEQLVEENRRRTRTEPEFELVDTGVFAGNRFFDIEAEYAKAGPEEVLVRIHAINRGPEPAPLHVVPMLWFRNDWAWCEGVPRPNITRVDAAHVCAEHATLGIRYLSASDSPELCFTENETNRERLYGAENATPHVKDGLHRYIVNGEKGAVHEESGTKCGFWYHRELAPEETWTIELRLRDGNAPVARSAKDFDAVFHARREEAGEFYAAILPEGLDDEERAIARSAFAGLLWSRQWYYYVVQEWLDGDPALPPPPPERRGLRNREWVHLYNDDVLSMPDGWEYPWYAVWDSAFHTVTLALVDPADAKKQLSRFTREWYMHPNGQLPAYEWALSDVNPPVHAWAAYRVYNMEKDRGGEGDSKFLESVFHKLLMNFTWWVNRKDQRGDNVFQGGFLGMDNIGIFDRNQPPPTGGVLEQSDGTSWMAMYCLNMLGIAWELAEVNPAYEDIASKFFEHFLYISDAIYNIGGTGDSLWHEDDGFFYDQLHEVDGPRYPIRLRSMVGLTPLFAVEILDHGLVEKLPGFKRRMDWFFENRPQLTEHITCNFEPNESGRCLLSLVRAPQLKRMLSVMLDEEEFLSPYGIRSLSKHHAAEPFRFEKDGFETLVGYEPGTSRDPMFGGNSNWRGPVWFPVNFLLIEALRRYHAFWGDSFKVAFPTGSDNEMHLGQVADALADRLVGLFKRRDGRRPCFGDNPLLHEDPAWRDLLLFHEFFHGDTGEGLGASHQTGWTALAANLLIENR